MASVLSFIETEMPVSCFFLPTWDFPNKAFLYQISKYSSILFVYATEVYIYGKASFQWACLSGWLLLNTAAYVKSMNVADFAPWCFVLILIRVAWNFKMMVSLSFGSACARINYWQVNKTVMASVSEERRNWMWWLCYWQAKAPANIRRKWWKQQLTKEKRCNLKLSQKIVAYQRSIITAQYIMGVQAGVIYWRHFLKNEIAASIWKPYCAACSGRRLSYSL